MHEVVEDVVVELRLAYRAALLVSAGDSLREQYVAPAIEGHYDIQRPHCRLCGMSVRLSIELVFLRAEKRHRRRDTMRRVGNGRRACKRPAAPGKAGLQILSAKGNGLCVYGVAAAF